MCCCTCGVSVLLKRACPGNGCITWFILSMVFTIVVFGLLIALSVYTANGDGSFPIDDYKNFTGVVIAGNFFGFIGCLACLILIFLNKKSLVLSILCEVALVFGFCVTLYCIYYVSNEKPASRVSKYTRTFYKKTNKAPPLMDYVQLKARIDIPGIGETLGCCGSESFFDYSSQSRKIGSKTDFVFNSPDSCCKSKSKMPGCGQNLTYSVHYTELKFLNQVINLATGKRDKNLTISKTVDKILKQRMNDLAEIKAQVEKEMKTGTSKLTPGGGFLTDLISQKLKYLLTEEQIENLKNLPAWIEAIDKKSKELKEFGEQRKRDVKINVIGCGRIFDSLCTGCVTGFVAVHAVINAITILVYVYYYVRLGKLGI